MTSSSGAGTIMFRSPKLARPLAGAVPLVVSGSAAGIDTTPLVIRPIGQGCMVFCQMLLTEKYAGEPAAALLLGNLLSWLDAFQPQTGRTAVLGSEEYKKNLRSMGLQFDEFVDGFAVNVAATQGSDLRIRRLPLVALMTFKTQTPVIPRRTSDGVRRRDCSSVARQLRTPASSASSSRRVAISGCIVCPWKR